ncbi:nucleoside/nucleotide kinase family protein [Sulfitobacter sp. S190]|uniref:nucleoside/nucleotide kinase family protein n=1 Tax=Sulfitobacter sp. S190 TaxID=2867022 RepID=UPI0021A4D8F4|nr:nucleoside/nucleotide kinase family protein [Sulfitobacter sp. S190]UWR21861.1 nucleoside/nucleotide kinase family protein [Sulfitobacter sp. S190]
MSQDITADALYGRLAALPAGRRLVAVAGAPASGKSTLAEGLAARLPNAAVIPMDGFHYDNRVLQERGHLSRKGAPHTFDVGGLYHLLQRLTRNDAPEVAIPLFDRSIETSRAGAAIVPQSVQTLLVEGNYLLLDRAPWSTLRPLFDLTVMIAVSETVLRDRLIARWQGYGLSQDQIVAKLEENDLPNGRTVIRESVAADLTVQSV